MRLLLDTHGFLWFAAGSSQLSERAKALIEDGENDCFLSIASLWEISIKVTIGKLDLEEPFGAFVRQELKKNRIFLLPINLEHIERVAALPLFHRDPFDRIIAAQGLVEGMAIISRDEELDAYNVERLW
jgi:PIN domain nuclease of toxin-antitoxin system